MTINQASQYNSNSFVKNGARELKTYLKRQGYNNAVAIAHSKGGLVTRKYFLDNSSGRRIDRLVTIGTPHRGTYLINRGDDILSAAYKGVFAFVAPNHYNQNWLAITQSGRTGGYSYAWFWRWSGAKVPGATAWTQFGSSKKATFSPWQSKELKVEVTDSNGIKVEDIEIW